MYSQGTVLGPLLFLIMISDIDEEVQFSSVSMYADDTRIMKAVENQEDEEKLKTDLNSIYNWCGKNNMKFNADKFELIVFATKPKDQNKNYISPEGKTILEKQNLRDLGIQISNNLKFNDQIGIMVAKAQKMSGWILRTFKTREKVPLMILYKQMVRGILEYCCPLWSPIDKGMIDLIESVQKSFTRRLKGLSGEKRPDYCERLKILKIYSLERRRERYIIIYIFKTMCDLVPNPGFIVRKNDRTGPTLQVPIKTSEMNIPNPIYDRTLIVQGSKIFNILPKEIRENIGRDNINIIKTMLDNFLKTVPDQPTCYNTKRQANSNSLLDQIQYRSI